MAKFIGKKVDVLIESNIRDGSDGLEGVTDNYLQVRLPFKPGLKNKIVQVKLKSTAGDSFIGEYIDKT